MLLLFVRELFGGAVIQALCWTLLHSFWQGLLVAIAAGIVILLTRKSGPVIRYNLLSTLLFLFVLSAVITFSLELRGAGDTVHMGMPVVSGENTGTGLATGELVTVSSSSGIGQQFISGLVKYFDGHAFLVVIIWFVIFSARLVRILAHFGAIQRIRHHRTHSPSEYWRERLQELAAVLKIRMRVALLESEIVRVPMLAGFFRPVILIPFSLLSQMPPEQVEAVLLHELAHIRRGDYFVNIAQHFAEILFFFNPGVLWISSMIREERENCCDDIAVRHSGSKKEFIHALVSFQEFNNAGLQPAMAFAGSRGHLLQRVKRIVYHDNKILDVREKFFLLGCLLVTGVLTLAFSCLPQSVASSMKGKTLTFVQEQSSPREPSFSKQLTGPVTDTLVKPDTVEAAGARTRSSTTVAAGVQGASQSTSGTGSQNSPGTASQNTPGTAPQGIPGIRPQASKVLLSDDGLDSVPGREEKKERIRREREALLDRQKKLSEEQDRLWEEQKKLKEEEMKLSGSYEELAQADKEAGLDKEEKYRTFLLQKIERMKEDMQAGMEERKQMEELRKIEIENKIEMGDKINGMSDSNRMELEKGMNLMNGARKEMMKDQMRSMEEAKKAMMKDQMQESQEARKQMMKVQMKIMEENRRIREANWKTMEEDKKQMMIDPDKVLEQNRKNLEANLERMGADRKGLEADRRRMEAARAVEADRMADQRKILEENQKNMEMNRGKMEENRKRMEKDRYLRERQINDLKLRILNPIADRLYDEKIIADKENFSFSISGDGLIVNGVKQPDALYRALREKYAPELPDELSYSRKDGSESISINRHK